MKDAKTNEMLNTMMKCIAACETCVTECLNEDHPGHMVECINTCRDCADVCSTVARFVARNSQYTGVALQNCITICRDCAEVCRKHDTEHCQACADACEACVEACEEYSSVLPAGAGAN